MACTSTRQSQYVYMDTHSHHKGKLLTQHFTELTMEEVRAHAQAYQDRSSREAQNAEMLI